MKNLSYKFENFFTALERLNEVVAKYNPDDDILRDSIIQRFEFTYDCAWKALRSYLEYAGIMVDSVPIEVFKEGYAHKLLEDEQIWMQIIRSRNLTSHMYKEEMAQEVCESIVKIYVKAFNELAMILRDKI